MHMYASIGSVMCPDGKTRPFIWDVGNWAADFRINYALVASEIGKKPKNALYDPMISNGTEDYATVYMRTYDKYVQQPEADGNGAPDQSGPQQDDGDGGEEWDRLREAAARAARVDDRSLVPGLRADQADGWRYLVLGWCDGGSLADRLAGGRAPTADETARIVVRVARGLDALHRAGVVHGGVLTASILFDGDGRALLVPVATSSERSGAPEVQAGADATPLSDIYELAAIAQACLARTDSVSDDLDWAIGTALSADPAQRPQSAAMFGQMLRMAGRASTTG